MNAYIAIRSYKRAGQVTTLKLFPSAMIWVPESQEEDYAHEYGAEHVVAIPDEEDGSPARKFNAILNRAPSERLLILDDDITEIGYFEGGDQYTMTSDALPVMVEHYFGLAEQLGVRMWGMNQVGDPMAYRTYSPFAFLAPILGPFTGHLNPVLRYDESCGTKEDYDFWLQNIAEYHMTLRVNRYYYVRGAYNAPGGTVSMRTLAKEEAGVKRMLEKWGPGVFRRGGGTSGRMGYAGKNILNSKVHVPISGI